MSDEGTWFRIDNTSVASTVRRAADRLAEDLALPAKRAADLAIVAAELTSNLLKHTKEGTLLLHPVRSGDVAGVELLAVDSGPGMADLTRFMRDGHSTSGTLGIGLGAIVRQATWCDVHSVPGKGTVFSVQVWPGDAPEPAWAAGISRPITGETQIGDGYAVRVVEGRHQVLVSDGLGHGPLAAAASQAAVNSFRSAPAVPPAALVEKLHREISHTRGAAIAVAELDAAAGVVRYAGLGNIAGTIVEGTSRRGMISLPGIAGHQRRQIREYDYPISRGAAVVLHSDGVVDRWQPGDYPGLSSASPVLIAATVMRDAGVRRDDACVLAARLPS
ncbi:ATP-binding SpoIIE family protein phosphatase [Catenuloplanes japonicus]|uniref:ATP-binding SpoIIE family protein phosphatase n=1 Tax=Catenuloplanes japonicus TaxID=33876 RepID=UPI000527866B|nr:ATP-binding SpoIIE family protein phosphatase [Catenuloplanes japonicus]